MIRHGHKGDVDKAIAMAVVHGSSVTSTQQNLAETCQTIAPVVEFDDLDCELPDIPQWSSVCTVLP